MARPFFASLFLAALAACTDRDPIPIGTQQLGESCDQVSDCAPGLTCRSSSCVAISVPPVPGDRGSDCSDGQVCAASFCCGQQDVCRERLESFEEDRCGAAPGGECGLSADCDRALVCAADGTCAERGEPGTAPIGAACEAFEDCERPFLCGLNDECVAPTPIPPISCLRSEEERGAFRMYFEVPRGAPLSEFYRHPFPSDLRRTPSGGLDLSGHPSPGSVLGVDLGSELFAGLAEDSDGFGLSAPIFVRFSDPVELDSLTVNTATASLRLIEIDPDAENRGVSVPIEYRFKKTRGPYSCAHLLGVAPEPGVVLTPGRTYALLLTRAIRGPGGEVPITDGDFAPLLLETSPADPALNEAHRIFAPLRDFLREAELDPAELAGATVFTTGTPARRAEHLRSVVRSATVAGFSDLVRCRAGQDGPCGPCVPETGDQFIFMGRVGNPVLQQGVRPYSREGGRIAYDSAGRPLVSGEEALCFGLSVPRGAVPAGGFPLVIYAHGTGGSVRTGLEALAGDLAAASPPLAVLTYDGVMHGARQGLPDAIDPGGLFFNLQNPRASRDNVLQGAADLHRLVAFAQQLRLGQVDTGVNRNLRFDSNRILFYGHSQGTVVAAPFLAFEPGIRAAVLTGAGADIALSLIDKRKPTDLASFSRIAFGDRSVARIHPLIGLWSALFGPADALPYARAWGERRELPPLDRLHVYGRFDLYTPESTQAAWARAGAEPLVGTVLRALPGVPAVSSPVRENVAGQTVGVLQFTPPASGGGLAYDGHFVGSRNTGAVTAIQHFLETAAAGAGRAEIRREMR